MKTLKSKKGHAMVRPRKSAFPASHPENRERITSRPKVRSRHSEASGPVSRARTQTGHKRIASTVPARPPVDVQYQTAIKNFETGVRAFQKQNYSKAAEIFEKLVESDARDVAERAHMHLRLCRQRTGRPAPLPKSADEYYTLGVACLNAREFERAVEHLSKADKMKPHQDHIHYALAVSHALAGNP